MVSMYCVKCRAKKEVDNPEKVTMKNGKPGGVLSIKGN